MANISVVQDEVLKDEFGNGIFTLNICKKHLLGKTEYYIFKVYRNENQKISGCILEKSMNEGAKKYVFDLRFEEDKTNNNFVKYRKIDVGYDQIFDVLKSDVMFNVKLRKEENQVLKEFDKMMWIDSKHSQSKATLIDVFTDVIDTTERDDTTIDGVKISDVETIHMVTKGFFAEVKPNSNAIQF